MELLTQQPTTEHGHGAPPDPFMVHLARWEDDDATGGEHVTDDEDASATATATAQGA